MSSPAVVRSLGIAAETSYGSISATTGLPVPAGSYFPFAVERASFDEQGGASELVEDTRAFAGAFGAPPVVGTVFSGGVAQRRQTGSLSLRMMVHAFGGGVPSGAVASAAGLPLLMMLRSSMSYAAAGSALPAIVTASPGVVDFASPPGLAVGEVVVADVDGCLIANRVTEVAGVGVTFLHHWPRALTPADTITRGYQLFIGEGAGLASIGPSLTLEARTLDTITRFYGVRLESVTFSPEANGVLFADLELRAALVVPDVQAPSSVAVVNAEVFQAPACNVRGSALRRTNGDTGAGNGELNPLSLASTSMRHQVESLSLALSFGLQPIGTGCGMAGEADARPGSWSVTFDYTAHETRTDDQRDLVDRISRGLSMAAGPRLVGTNPHNAVAWNIPAAYLTADHNVTAPDGSLLQQSRSYAAGAYRGDDGAPTRSVVIFIGGAP